jgi:membrane-associated phospholipid phosphatase
VVLLACVAAAAFVVLTVLVATGTTRTLDVAARDYFRPHDEWGPLQMRVDTIVEGLKPRNVAVLLVLLAVGMSLWRRSWRPGLYVALTGALAGAATVGVKMLLHRTDPHHEMTSAAGGSFPSGHTLGVVLLCGLVVLLLRPRSRWWEWTPVALAGAAMAFSLVVQAAHWFTDVVGGCLLAVVVLATVSLLPLRQPAGGYRRPLRAPRRAPRRSSRRRRAAGSRTFRES